MGNTNQTLTALDPLTLDPRAISLLIGVARFPEGATINKLSGLLAMSYRSIRALCANLAGQKPPLLLVQHGIYDTYTLNPNANLRGLVIQTGLCENTTVPQPTHPKNSKTINQKRKHSPNKRSNLKIESLRAKRLDLKDIQQLDFLQKLINSDSLSETETSLKDLSLNDQTFFKDFKNIRIGKIEIDTISLVPPDDQAPMMDQAERTISQPQPVAQPLQRNEQSPEQVTNQTAVHEQPRQRGTYKTASKPTADRRVTVEKPNQLFGSFHLINDRSLVDGEINPRHNLQYLLHADELFEHSVLWHPKFAEVDEKTLLAWLAQAYEGMKSGKITQPWGIVYRGLLGELPFPRPDKRFREGAKNMLPRDFLVACGYHIPEEDLPPTPEEEPDWQAEEGQLYFACDMDDDDDIDDVGEDEGEGYEDTVSSDHPRHTARGNNIRSYHAAHATPLTFHRLIK